MTEFQTEVVDAGVAGAATNSATAPGGATAPPEGFAKSTPGTPPAFIGPSFEKMPPQLKILKNWLLWAPVWNGTKWTKRPIQISGYGASTTKRKHWSSFDDVKQAYELAVARGYMELREGKPIRHVPGGGVGFVFGGQPDADGLVFAGVDFDKVISGSDICS